MNLYNVLFMIEYTRTPIHYILGDKIWILNLSKKKDFYIHRDFDLPAVINNDYKGWYKCDKYHKLIKSTHPYIMINKFPAQKIIN